MDLIETHSRVNEKIGVGIASVRVSKVQYNTKSFELVRADSSTEFFSYTKKENNLKLFINEYACLVKIIRI